MNFLSVNPRTPHPTSKKGLILRFSKKICPISFNNFNTAEFNTINKQIYSSGYDKMPYQSTSLLYSAVQPTASSLVCRSQDIQDTKQLWIHFGTAVFILHGNVNICLRMGHIMYSGTACSISLIPLTTSLYVKHPETIYSHRPHTRQTQGDM